MPSERDGHWVAQRGARRHRQAFGIDCTGATRDQAIDRLGRWLEWQAEHAAALAALQVAERIHYRTMAGTFASQTAPAAAKQETLEALDAARIRLDSIRSRKPETSA